MGDENRKEQVDRELIELLNELRVALPGVQVLFAFLLVLPFQSGFDKVDELARDVYFAGMLAAVVAIVLLIAPATYHRLTMRRGTAEKEEMLFTSSKLALFGTGFLGLSVCCSLFVVADVMFGNVAAFVVAILAGALIVGLWYAMPLLRHRARTRNRDVEDAD